MTRQLGLAAAVLALLVPSPHQSSPDSPLRPRFHFAPRQNFMNDPNGLVYYRGEYHLFYQYNPFGTVWGHMSWGHAVSRDMLHWEHLPVALSEEDSIMIFSGSAVVDRDNSSGLCQQRAGDKSCLVAIYTGHGRGKQTQNLAYSNDRGRTWTKYAGNPVIDLGLENFRDPKVFRHEPTGRWIMVTVLADQHKVRFFGSRNLKDWEFLSDFGPEGAVGGVWECPDLFPLPVDGDAQESRWVLDVDLNPGGYAGGSGGQYFVGQFDGVRFINDNPANQTLWVDYGKDFYATTSFSDLPRADKRRIWMGWVSNWEYANEEPTETFRGALSLPRTLLLRRLPEGIRLVQTPIAELKSLRLSAKPIAIQVSAPLPAAAEFELTVSKGSWREAGLRFRNRKGEQVTVGVAASPLEVFVNRNRARLDGSLPRYAGRHAGPVAWRKDRIRLRVLFDRSVVEVFVNDGEQVVTERFYPREPFTRVERVGGASVRMWGLK